MIRWTAFVGCMMVATSAAAQQQPKPKPPSLQELETRAQQDSLDPEAHFRLATRYYQMKRWADEERELRTTIAIDPRYAPAYLWLGDLPFDRRPKLWKEQRAGKVPAEYQPAVEESHRLWRQAFFINPLVDFRVMGTSAPPEDLITIPDYGGVTTEFLVILGLGAFGATRYELAYNALDMWAQRAFANKPKDSIPDFLFLYRGLSAGHLRAYNKAIADIQVLYDRSLQAERSDSLLPFPMKTNDYRYLLGVLNQLWGKHWVAVQLFEETLASDLGLYMAHVRLGQVYRSLKMWDKAIAEARRALETHPNEAPAVRELGLLLDDAGRSEEGMATLEQSAALNPRDPRTIYHLGVVQHKLARAPQARESLQRFVAMAPATIYERELTDAKQRLGTLQP